MTSIAKALGLLVVVTAGCALPPPPPPETLALAILSYEDTHVRPNPQEKITYLVVPEDFRDPFFAFPFLFGPTYNAYQRVFNDGLTEVTVVFRTDGTERRYVAIGRSKLGGFDNVDLLFLEASRDGWWLRKMMGMAADRR